MNTMTSISNTVPRKKITSMSTDYHRRNARQRRITFLLLVSPALLWFLAFMLWPLFNMFYISTMRWDGLAFPQKFVFLNNFARFLHDPNITIALRNTGIIFW